jgi:hypothetical protein
MTPYPCAHQFEKFYDMNLLATQVRKTTLQLQLDPCKPTGQTEIHTLLAYLCDLTLVVVYE